MTIEISLEKTANGTELRGLFDVTGTGQLKPIVDRLFEKRATERAAQFADCLQKRFGAVSPASASAQAPAGSLSRFWRRLLEWFTPRRN